ncbi:MAG: glycosyltransferase family 4 protein [Planctomycetota bacterium]|jgi:glycosyltransferase involved in cell wall biosynthesis
MGRSTRNVQTVALLGSYVPRQCGIATFTKDLRDGLVLAQGDLNTIVLALDDTPAGYAYPDEVRFQIQASRIQDYASASDLLNINQIDLVVIQHEFGIYGGHSGDHVLTLMRNLRMPVITSLHTVLEKPTKEQATVMKALVRLSEKLVVMCERGVTLLREVYRIPESKIAFIPHGIPDVPFVDPAFHKDLFALEGKTVLLTFGLISPGKGIETAIKALPRIVEKHRDVVYVVLGAVHPHVFKREGNAYLNSLQNLAEDLGVQDHVSFHTRYVTLEELCGYLGAADLYLTPYINKDQIVSGTLAYAMGAGKAVLSTPYSYAEEMLAEERGILFPFGDSEALADEALKLLDDHVLRDAMRKRAYVFCRDMVWKEVGRQYILLGAEAIKEQFERPKPVFQFRARAPKVETFPEIDTRHLRTLTDDTGMLQHAVYSVPNRLHGYCTDDNARALLAAVQYYDLAQDDSILPYITRYMSFLHYAFNEENRRFRNFLSYDRQWLEQEGSDDTQGRAMWALGSVVAYAPNEAVLSFASRHFTRALENAKAIKSPRAWAFTLVGIHAYLRRFSGDAFARRMRRTLARRLYSLFKKVASDEWPWCEEIVTYDNGKIPHALIMSGCWLPDNDMFNQGLVSLDWLIKQQMADDGKVSLIGNQGWMTREGHRARFDQQPLDVLALVDACLEAYRATQENAWRRRAEQCFRWFLGNNDTQSVLYDAATGGCRDGLHSDGPNLNQGSESTLAWLLSLFAIHHLHRMVEVVTAAEIAPPAEGTAIPAK